MTKKFLLSLIFLLIPSTPILADILEPVLGEQNPYQNVKVEKVLSSDTIVLEDNKQIHLIGIKSPTAPKRDTEINRDENGFIIKKPVDPTTPPDEQSFLFTQGLLVGQYVRLEFDADRKDSEYHTLAYVYLVKDKTFVNAEILRQGYAYLQISPPNLKHEDELRAAYKEAKNELRGLYAQ